jgi:DNA-binding YbaB/EbfC family protein
MNMMKLMKQAQTLQKDMKKKQAALAKEVVEFSAGGGAVVATATCDLAIKSIKIKPEVVDADDVEMLEDLVLSAVDGVMKAAQEKMSAEMGALTQGMGLPGGGGLF